MAEEYRECTDEEFAQDWECSITGEENPMYECFAICTTDLCNNDDFLIEGMSKGKSLIPDNNYCYSGSLESEIQANIELNDTMSCFPHSLGICFKAR